MSEEKSQQKHVYFTFLLYPESIPNDWVEKLESTDIAMAISPLHDKDKTEKKEMLEQGQEFKKEHYHVIYIAKSPVTADAVRKRIKRLLGDKAINMVQPIATSVVNAYLYLTHESKDAIAKNKHKYDKKDIKLLNNFDVDRYQSLDASERKEIVETLIYVIKTAGLINAIELDEFFDDEDYVAQLKAKGKPVPTTKTNYYSIVSQYTGLLRLYFEGKYQTLTNKLPDWRVRMLQRSGGDVIKRKHKIKKDRFE